MPKLVRVRDSVTGHEYSTALVLDQHKVLDEPAVDAHGRALPAKAAEKATKKSASSSDSGDKSSASK